MNLRSLGPGAPAVSAVGYGGMHLSVTDGRPSEPQSLAVIHAALDAGVTLIDTADAYSLDEQEVGHNERLIAKALASWRGDPSTITVATKGGVVRTGGRWDGDGSPAHLRAAADRVPPCARSRAVGSVPAARAGSRRSPGGKRR